MGHVASKPNEDEVRCDGRWSHQARGSGGKAAVGVINQNSLSMSENVYVKGLWLGGCEGVMRVQNNAVGEGGQWWGIGDVREIRVRSVWCNLLDICASMTDKTRRVLAPGVLTHSHTHVYKHTHTHTHTHIHIHTSLPHGAVVLSLSGSQRLGTNETKWSWSLSVKRLQAVKQSVRQLVTILVGVYV